MKELKPCLPLYQKKSLTNLQYINWLMQQQEGDDLMMTDKINVKPY